MRDSSRFLDFAWSDCTDALPSPLAGNLAGLRVACSVPRSIRWAMELRTWRLGGLVSVLRCEVRP
jgi:hypothetical protein